MSEQKTRFVVGGVYRRERQKSVGGYQIGMLLDAVEEANGRLHGRITVGGEVAIPINADRMENWELVSEPGNPIVKVGPKYVTDEDLRRVVEIVVGERSQAMSDRLLQLEHENLQLRTRIKAIEEPVSNGAGVRERARM